MAAAPEVRRDAVVALAARTISDRGFSDSPTAHAALGLTLLASGATTYASDRTAIRELISDAPAST